jgi:hypothetical protein
MQDRNRKVRGCTKAKKSDAVAAFNPCHAQAAEADDSGAQKRCGVQIVELWRQLENEIIARARVLRITAIDGISGEGRSIAKIFHSTTAVRAISVDPANP